jgi:hypothetical protein
MSEKKGRAKRPASSKGKPESDGQMPDFASWDEAALVERFVALAREYGRGQDGQGPEVEQDHDLDAPATPDMQRGLAKVARAMMRAADEMDPDDAEAMALLEELKGFGDLSNSLPGGELEHEMDVIVEVLAGRTPSLDPLLGLLDHPDEWVGLHAALRSEAVAGSRSLAALRVLGKSANTRIRDTAWDEIEMRTGERGPHKPPIDPVEHARFESAIETMASRPRMERAGPEVKPEKWEGQPLDRLTERFIAAGKSIPPMMMGADEVEIYNRAVRITHDIGLAMEAHGQAGQEALIALMAHDNFVVRARAGAACRGFARDHAVNVLADVCELNVGQMSMDAMHSLLAIGAFDMKAGPIRPGQPYPKASSDFTLPASMIKPKK